MAKYPHVAALFERTIGKYPEDGALYRLSVDVGVSAATATRWAQGENRPKRKYWPALARHLKVEEAEVEAAYNGEDVTGPTLAEVDRKIVAATENVTAALAQTNTRLKAVEAALRRFERALPGQPTGGD